MGLQWGEVSACRVEPHDIDLGLLVGLKKRFEFLECSELADKLEIIKYMVVDVASKRASHLVMVWG